MNTARKFETPIGTVVAKPAPDPRKLFQVYVPGATKDEIERGWQAAFKVFEEATIHPYRAAEEFFELEGYEFSGETKPADPNELELKTDPNVIVRPDPAAVWLQADAAAAKAICEGWRRPAKTANLSIDISFKRLASMVDEGIKTRGSELPER